MHIRKIYVYSSLCFLLILGITFFCPECSYAASLDDVLSNVLQNAFKKAGKNLDDLASLKKGEAFSTLIRKNDDFLKISRKGFDDDLLAMKKIGFPAGSKYIDELLSLSKQERRLAYALDDVASKVAKLPAGDDMIRTVGKKGLLLGTVYGDEFLEGAYRLARQEDVWDATRKSVKVLDKDNSGLLKLMDENGFTTQFRMMQGVDEYNPVDLMVNVVRKYGPRAQESVFEFFRRIKTGAQWLDENRRVILYAFVAVVYIDPSLVLDPLGRLKDNVVDKFIDGVATLSAEAVETLVYEVPVGFGKTFTERFIPNGPAFLKNALIYLIAFFFLMSVFYLIPFTRFIPRSVVAALSSLFGWILSFRFRRNRENAASSAQKQGASLPLPQAQVCASFPNALDERCGEEKNTLPSECASNNQQREISCSATNKENNEVEVNAADRFQMVLETHSLNESQLLEYCRVKGILPEDIKRWREACIRSV